MQSLYYANPLFAMIMIKPFTPLYNDDGTYNLDIPENNYSNPRATAEYDPQWEKQYKLNTNAYLEYNIVKGLTIKTTNGIELTDGEGVRYWSPEANYGQDLGILQVSRTKYILLTTSNTLNYSGETDKHSYSAVAGQEASKYDYNEYFIYSPGVDPNIPSPIPQRLRMMMLTIMNQPIQSCRSSVLPTTIMTASITFRQVSGLTVHHDSVKRTGGEHSGQWEHPGISIMRISWRTSVLSTC